MKHAPTAQGWRLVSAVAFLTALALFGLQAHANDDLPTVTIEDATAREGSIITFVARLDKPNRTRQLLRFSWKTKGGTATPGQDYTDNEYTASFWPGASETEIHIFTTRDDLDEGSETFELVASDPWRLKLGNATATGTIEDSPKRSSSNLPVVSVLPGAGVTEGEAALFTLVASPRPARPLRVSVTIGQTGAFAASGQTGRRTVTIASRGQASFMVRTTDDGRNEAPGSVDVKVNSGSGYSVSGSSHRRSASVDVADNDRPVISIGAGSKISEGRAASFTLSASPRPAAPIAVKVAVTQKGEFASQDQLGERTVTVGTDGRGTLGVATDSDTRDEDDGFITASLTGGQAYRVGTPASARVVVTDGGAPTPRIGVRALSSAIVEGGTARFELTASPRPATPLDVRVDVTDSGSFAGQGEIGTRTVTIGTTGRATIEVETDNDLVSEPDGSLTARVLAGTGYLVASSGRASVQVRDESVQVRISAAGNIVEGGTAMFTLTAHPAPPESLVVNVDIAEKGSFLPGGAYAETITVGTDGRQTFSVDTIHDERAEADGAIVATVGSGYGYEPGSPARATARVSDSTPTVTIAAGPAVIEGDTARFSLTARPAPKRNLTVRLKVTEVAGGSFVPSGELGQRDVTIYAADGTGTLELSTEDDTKDEAGGTVTAAILADEDGYYRTGSPRSATLRVNDDDHGSNALTVSVADAEVKEGQRDDRGRKTLAFPVTLSKPASHWVTVYFHIRPREEGSGVTPATPDVDYRATGHLAARWIRFRPGVTETFTHVDIYDDDEDEPEETFELVIRRAWGAEIADGRAIGTILPDPLDAPRGTPVVTITAEGAVEEGRRATFKLRAAPAPEEDLVVNVTVYDDSYGTPESDYLADSDEGSKTVTIPGIANRRVADYYGDSIATLTLNTVDDDKEEGGGKISVYVDNPGDGSYKAGEEFYSAEVGVRDNDGPRLSVAPAFSIADATAYESDGSIRFDVTLDPPVPPGAGPMTVDYQTLTWAGGAQREADFEDRRGTLTFYEGESWKEIEIAIKDDRHDEGAEDFRVYLWNARGGARIADHSATGTIMNSDPMPAAWLARFGRAVAEQALDGVADRISASRTAGVQGTIAGQPLNFGSSDGSGAANGNAAPGNLADQDMLARSHVARAFGASADGWGAGAIGHDAHGFATGSVSGAGSYTMTGLEALLGSSFTATGEKDGMGGSLAFWGRAAQSSFDGREGTFSLDGDATSAMLGADYARGRWLAGMALMRSSGEGGYADSGSRAGGGADSVRCPQPLDAEARRVLCGGAVREGDGEVEASLTAAIPYAAIQASEGLKLWGAAGYGAGEVTLKPEVGGSLGSDIAWTMAAAGMRNDLVSVSREGSGLALALASDALWTRTSSEKTHELAASESDVTRLRLGLEGSYRIATEGGGSLTPKLEIGARHDGGDAETGFGVELGGGLAWVDPGLGLSLDLSGRTLVAHGSDDLEDRGFAASLAFDPDTATARGPSLTLTQDWGGQAKGGLDALFASDPLADRTGGGEATARWAAEAAWGFPAFSGRFTGSPHVGLGLATGARDYSLGWRLVPAANAPDVSFGVKGTRRESGWAEPEHTAGLEATMRW